jgi:hypothetical protein
VSRVLAGGWLLVRCPAMDEMAGSGLVGLGEEEPSSFLASAGRSTAVDQPRYLSPLL